MIFMGVGVVFTVPVRCFFFHSELPLNEDVRVLYHGEIASVNGGCEILLKKNKVYYRMTYFSKYSSHPSGFQSPIA